jgi:hypothetical protein
MVTSMKFKTLTAAAVLLAACATAPEPTYQPAIAPGHSGWLIAPAEDGRHTVQYTGAKSMTREQVAQFALQRAAEFTTESGQEWFAVFDTKSQQVPLLQDGDLQGKTGGFVNGGEASGTGTGASPSGVRDSATRGGPSTGGFGGGDVPYQVLERWTPPTVHQTVVVIQMGKGDQARFAGDRAPQIYSAATVLAELRAKAKP